MSKIKLNFSKLPIPQKLAKARQIVTALTGNTSFTNPQPALTAVTTAINDLDGAYAEVQAVRQTAKEATSRQSTKEDALLSAISQLAAYVESVAGDDEEKILSAGMDPRAVGVTTDEPPDRPEGLTVTEGDHEGELDLSWDKVPGAKSYAVEKSTPQADSWGHAGVSVRSQFTAGGLPSGIRFWFRVAAVNSNGQSGWSDFVTKVVS